MGQDSKIEWCHHTFNPWIGCSKVSDGCKFCYAEQMMDKRYGKVKWGPGGTRNRTSEANWKQPLKWNREAKESGERRRVFCASLADVFEDRDELKPWRAELCELIEQCRWLDFLLLTKRPENANPMIGAATGRLPHAWLAECKHGESGAGARPVHPDWVRSIRDQCQVAGVPFFFKQWGEWEQYHGLVMESDGGFLPDGTFIRNPELTRGYPRTYKTPTDVVWMHRVGKKSAGRILDGRTWDEMPQSHATTAK